ncbi:HD domain-containing protein [bacterium]|nr:HD domain-containing protein [bacterium]
MSAVITEVGPELVGKRLGQKLYSSKGSLLLGQGTEITDSHNSRIHEAGYRSVYVADLNGQSVIIDEPEHVVSEKLRAKLPSQLKAIFEQLLSKNKITISDGKKKLNQFADTLVKGIQHKITEPPGLLDLKRMEDYLFQHPISVAAYSIIIGRGMGYHQLKLYDLAIAALLCDIGMHFIDEDTLNKTEELTEEEFEEIKKHTMLGFQHLGRQCFLKGLITIVALQHHEKFDGTGYPNGIAGDKIHEYSRIISVADFFDAYTSDRPYRRLHTINEALDYLRAESGQQFDPSIVKRFLSIFE